MPAFPVLEDTGTSFEARSQDDEILISPFSW